jgi:trans-aconitate 2-methyltransferase
MRGFEAGMTQTYEWDAAAYARHAGAQFEWATELIGKLGLRGDEALLDIGCGDGRVTALLARHLAGGWVMGIDRSWAMAAAARHTYHADDYPNLRVAQMDAARLGLGGAFDVAFSNAVLHWVCDHLAVLRGARRALRPGGRLLFQMGGRGNVAAMMRVMAEVAARPAWRAHFAEASDGYYFFYHPDDYRRWTREAGLRLVRAELIAKDMRQAGAAGLAGWIRSTWLPYVERVPSERREAFVQEATAAYLADYPPDAEGVVHVAMVRLEVEARRG